MANIFDQLNAYNNKQLDEKKKGFRDGLYWIFITLFFVSGYAFLFSRFSFSRHWKLLLVAFISGGLGVFIFIKWYKHKKAVLDCLPLVKPKGITPLSDVAEVRRITTEQVAVYLQELINRGFYSDAYIDYKNGLFVASADRTFSTKCEHCGASWILTEGTVDVCPFCGAILANEKQVAPVHETSHTATTQDVVMAPSISEKLSAMQNKLGTLKHKDSTEGLDEEDYREVDNVGYNVDEMNKVVSWISEEHKRAENYGGDESEDGKIIYYAVMTNRSGIDFKQFSIEATLVPKIGEKERICLLADNWKDGEKKELYYQSRYKPKELNALNMDVMSIRFSKA